MRNIGDVVYFYDFDNDYPWVGVIEYLKNTGYGDYGVGVLTPGKSMSIEDSNTSIEDKDAVFKLYKKGSLIIEGVYGFNDCDLYDNMQDVIVRHKERCEMIAIENEPKTEKEKFWDECGSIGCCNCIYFRCGGCDHRVDNKHINYYRNPFASASKPSLCSDFKLNARSYPWAAQHWKDEYYPYKEPSGTISFFVDGNEDVAYVCDYKDYYYNTLFDNDNKLKWKYKMYYKRSTKSPTGYVLLNEYPDGKICINGTKERLG